EFSVLQALIPCQNKRCPPLPGGRLLRVCERKVVPSKLLQVTSAIVHMTAAKRRIPGPERREQILATARRVFATRGYEGFNVDEVAALVGVSKPVLYRHFSGKRDLYHAVLEEHLAELIRRLWVALSSSPDPRARLRACLE